MLHIEFEDGESFQVDESTATLLKTVIEDAKAGYVELPGSGRRIGYANRDTWRIIGDD